MRFIPTEHSTPSASQALVGLALFIAVRSSGARLYSAALAWISLALFNVAAVLGTVTLDMGLNYGQEYREWLWWIRVILGLGLVTAAWNMIATVERRDSEDIYLSNWYTIGGTLWTIIIVLVSILPWYQYRAGPGRCSGVLHAQRRRPVVHAAGARRLLLCTAEDS